MNKRIDMWRETIYYMRYSEGLAMQIWPNCPSRPVQVDQLFSYPLVFYLSKVHIFYWASRESFYHDPTSIVLFQIPKLKPYKPAPKTTYVEPTEQTVMSQIKEKNRRKAEVLIIIIIMIIVIIIMMMMMIIMIMMIMIMIMIIIIIIIIW